MAQKAELKVTSKSFENKGDLPKKYTKYGENVSPHFHWENAPKETKSFAMIFDDPDAIPIVGYPYLHWAIKDIPADVNEFQENEYKGTQVLNSAKEVDYLGPKPPEGTGKHNYQFKFFALDVEKLDAKDADEMLKECPKHAIAEGLIVGCHQFGQEK